MLVGFAEMPPIAFIFCGNFCSVSGTPEAYRKLRGVLRIRLFVIAVFTSSMEVREAKDFAFEFSDGFRNLAKLISQVCQEHADLQNSNFVFVPGPEDPSLPSILPRSFFILFLS